MDVANTSYKKRTSHGQQLIFINSNLDLKDFVEYINISVLTLFLRITGNICLSSALSNTTIYFVVIEQAETIFKAADGHGPVWRSGLGLRVAFLVVLADGGRSVGIWLWWTILQQRRALVTLVINALCSMRITAKLLTNNKNKWTKRPLICNWFVSDR